jgi:hypothetical protein
LRHASLTFALCAQLLLVPAGAAIACEGPRTLLAEDFRFVDDAWTQGPEFRISDGKATIRTEAGTARSVFYGNVAYGDIDVCMTAVMPPDMTPTPQGAAGVGLIFWSSDASSYFLAAIYANGGAAVFRNAGNVWTPVVVREALTPPLRTEAGARATLRLTLSGNTGTFQVNGARVAGFRGDLPAGARSRIGIFAQSDATRAAPFDILGLKVTDLPSR